MVESDPAPLWRVPFRSVLAALACSAALVGCGGTVVPNSNSPTVERVTYTAASASLVIEILDDSVVHFEFSAAGGKPNANTPLYSTPMVFKRDYAGPRQFANDGRGTLRTAALKVVVDTSDLCLTVTDTGREVPVTLTTICPSALGEQEQSLTIASGDTQHVYGLGEHFLTPGAANGDWRGKCVEPGNGDGNALTAFNGGNTGNAQFPVMYAVGEAGQNYALFLDHLYAQEWCFTASPWKVRTSGGQIRGYVLAGPDLAHLRSQYMELVGRPPVPPKKMFGLWVSEFGYKNWAALEDKLRTLRANHFPVDGFLMDLQWFGGVFRPPSQMGALTWDTTQFPNPADTIASLREEQGIGLMVIEEPYVVTSRPEYATLAAVGYLARQCDGCEPVNVSDFWGKGGMIDWTNEAAGDAWHDSKRQPLIDMGVLGHWTDLGEPEAYDPTAWYFGFPDLGLHTHRDVHNIYNFKWIESINRGYARNGAVQRPFMLSRSGTSGIQRFGAAMWSGDIGSNLASLAAHFSCTCRSRASTISALISVDIGAPRSRET